MEDIPKEREDGTKSLPAWPKTSPVEWTIGVRERQSLERPLQVQPSYLHHLPRWVDGPIFFSNIAPP